MNSRRSKSAKLVLSHTKPLEIDTEEDSRMSTSAENTVYCCIAKDKNVLYSYNSKDGHHELENKAMLCLEHTPPNHQYYFHTRGTRTYGFLMSDRHTFFAIIDPSVGNVATLQFLEHVQDAFFKNMSNNGFHDAVMPIIRRLVASLEKMPRSSLLLYENFQNGEGGMPGDGCSSSSKVPLLGRSGSRKDKKKMKERAAGDVVDEGHGSRGVRIDVPSSEEVGGLSLEQSLSQGRLRRQQSARSTWLNHVKVIVIVDAVLCLVLFAVWLGVCKGFQCVSGE